MASDTFVVQRSARISASASAVYERVADFHEWVAWSPWEGIDPNLARTYSTRSGAVGSSYHWKGNRKVGEGEMTFTSLVPNEKVALDLSFLKPFKAQNFITITMTESDGGTDVDWVMEGPKTWMTKIMGLFKSMDKMVGPDFEKGLAQLKAVVEK